MTINRTSWIACVVGVLTGCSSNPVPNRVALAYSYTPTDVSINEMTIEEARGVFTRTFLSQYPDTFKGIYFIDEGETLIAVNNASLPEIRLSVSEFIMPQVTEYSSAPLFCITYSTNDGWNNACLPDEASAKAFADAIYEIIIDAKSLAPVKFQQLAIKYRALSTKPQLPEFARKYAVQATYAVSQRQYLDAMQLYDLALSTAPWWAAGHYNVALILAEQGFYIDAIAEMKKYLLLVPDAPDAQKAQDQIYVWERRASQQSDQNN